MKILFTNITLIIFCLIIVSCSSENDNGKDSKIIEPQMKALEKAKNVEKELLKRKEKLDNEEVKY